jgi:nucleotide-binding universal stress UspA family protein
LTGRFILEFRRGPVVAACDLSASSLAAVAVAKATAERFAVPLIVLHAVSFARLADAGAEGNEVLEATRDALAAALANVGLASELRIIEGPAAAAILRAGRELGAMLVVMAADGVGGDRRHRLGSVAHEVARGADSSVLTVRTTKATEQ